MAARAKLFGDALRWLSVSLAISAGAGLSSGCILPATGAQEEGKPAAAGNESEEVVKKKPRLMLTGAVIRYDKISQSLSREQWTEIMEELSALGIKTIIIQQHHIVPRQGAPAGTAFSRLPTQEMDFLPAKYQQQTNAESHAGAAQSPDGVLPRHTAVTEKNESAAQSRSGAVHDKSTGAPPRSNSAAGQSNSVTGRSNAAAGHGNSVTGHSNAVAGHGDAGPEHANAIAGATAGGSGEKIDATGLILDYADAHDMNVYLGLWLDFNWYGNLDVADQLADNLNKSKVDMAKLESELTSKKANPNLTAAEIKDAEAEIAVCRMGLNTVQNELDEKAEYFAARADGELAGPTIKIADALIRLYGHHGSFVGWYFPEEIWDAAFSNQTIKMLNNFLKFITDHCREASAPHKRYFALSPYASRMHYDKVDDIVAAHKELLGESGVDILMLQDSIGDQNLIEDEDIAVRLKKHFTAFSRVAAALKIKLWAELETFTQNQSVRKPASIERFKKQFQYSYPYLDKSNPIYVAFDYLHFFSLTPAKYPFAEERAKLYDDYKRDFVDSTFEPLTQGAGKD